MHKHAYTFKTLEHISADIFSVGGSADDVLNPRYVSHDFLKYQKYILSTRGYIIDINRNCLKEFWQATSVLTIHGHRRIKNNFG